MIDLLVWLLAVEVLGFLAFPFCFSLLRRLPDRGFSVAKPLALILFSYCLWVLGLTRAAPNTQLTTLAILVAGLVISAYLFGHYFQQIKSFVRAEWRSLLATETVFLLFFLLWAAITSESPAINHTEKPMDFGFMNAVLQSRFFPPEDPWLAGQSISYYYFGHFAMAFIVKLTAIPSSVGYNLAVSLIPAMVAAGAFGLVYNLIRLSGAGVNRAIVFALTAPVLIILVGNFEGVLEFVRLQGWGSSGFWEWVGIKGLDAGGVADSGIFPTQTWWWWRATRVIDTLSGSQSLDYTITEFPFFSYLLGDLHPHVVSLPFVLLGMFLCLNLLFAKGPPGLGWLARNPIESLALALFIGALAFINTWDFPLMATIFVAVVFVKSYGAGFDRPWRAAGDACLMSGPILFAAVLLFLPFYLTFSSQTAGILPLLENGTRPFLFLIVMGLFSLLGVSFLLRQLPGSGLPDRDDAASVLAVAIISVMPVAAWIGTVLIFSWFKDGSIGFQTVASRSVLVLPGLAIVGLAAFSAARRHRLSLNPETVFPLILLAAAFYLLVGAELFYVADSFGGGLRRMNTVFKVYYQAWLLLGLVGAYSLYHWFSQHLRLPERFVWTQKGGETIVRMGKDWTRKRRTLAVGHYGWFTLVTILAAGSLYYPVGGVLDRTGVLESNHTLDDNTLDGLAFLQNNRAGEYAAILWLRDRAPWGRLVEAVGDDYSEYGRISSSTGLPTVLGWRGHELQWRGSGLSLDSRASDVASIYQSGDGPLVRGLLDKHQVRYIYRGVRESITYGDDSLADFRFLKSAFSADGVTIYEYIP
jgi:YYY domain-containing protein